jgi:iron-sulfur cluster assembly protein
MVAITITDAAWGQIEKVLGDSKANPEAKSGLRVKVVGGGCSGLTYKMEVSDAKSRDRVFERNGWFVYVDTKSLLFLKGMTFDYKTGIMNSGFHFDNPNVKRSCGCGESFGV